MACAGTFSSPQRDGLPTQVGLPVGNPSSIVFVDLATAG